MFEADTNNSATKVQSMGQYSSEKVEHDGKQYEEWVLVPKSDNMASGAQHSR